MKKQVDLKYIYKYTFVALKYQLKLYGKKWIEIEQNYIIKKKYKCLVTIDFSQLNIL